MCGNLGGPASSNRDERGRNPSSGPRVKQERLQSGRVEFFLGLRLLGNGHGAITSRGVAIPKDCWTGSHAVVDLFFD